MAIIREYSDRDAVDVGILIKKTYTEFNLAYIPREEQALFPGPFHFAGDQDPEHQAAIDQLIRVDSSLYAVHLFERLGYKKSTGVRNSWSFDGYGLSIQPMRKVIK
ncbi:MAG: hypothetical protein J7L35_02065 [Anaerolineales bacterium]|nr:hypothetical protein [Anaerolineales bacterium]